MAILLYIALSVDNGDSMVNYTRGMGIFEADFAFSSSTSMVRITLEAWGSLEAEVHGRPELL